MHFSLVYIELLLDFILVFNYCMQWLYTILKVVGKIFFII